MASVMALLLSARHPTARRIRKSRKEESMQFQAGRLIDHVHLRVADLDASKRFYHAVFVALGKSDAYVEGEGHFSADELWVDRGDGYISRVHLAFQAPDRKTVDAFHRAAV